MVATARELEGPVSEHSLGAPSPRFPGGIRGGKDHGSGEGEEESRTARIDGWVMLNPKIC